MNYLAERRMALMGTKKKSRLPAEFQEVEYIQSDNYCRLDSGLPFDGTKDINIDIVCCFANSLNTTSGNGWNAGGWFGRIETGNEWFDGYNVNVTLSNIYLKTKVKQTIRAGTNTQTITIFENENGKKTTSRGHPNVSNRTFLRNYPFFATSNQNNFSYTIGNFRIYEAQLGYNGEILSDFVPCYRRSDGVIGMYDLLQRTFIENLGTGTLTKGPDVT